MVPAHPGWVVTVQEPPEQHAPVGAGQGLGVQTPATVKAPVQAPWVVEEQTPMMQQAPVTQGLGEQVEPGWPQVPAPQAD